MRNLLKIFSNKVLVVKKSLGIYKPKQYLVSNRIHTALQGNSKIYESIRYKSKEGVMISRFGSAELEAVINYLEIKNNSALVWDDKVKKDIYVSAGVFPISEPILERFSETYLKSIQNIDILGVWYLREEDKIIKDYCPNAYLAELGALEPYYFKFPWSRVLKGKKILVVHPFEKSIKKQYSIRERLFKNERVLPDFELKTFKSVQSFAYNEVEFKDWICALDWMKKEISSIDFDVAIIGCGAYGLPLAAYIKELGKVSIHMGGATQLLFGIKGKRWNAFPAVLKMYNNYWANPLPEETPDSASSVEGGCYW
jgi:hypothetical protein